MLDEFYREATLRGFIKYPKETLNANNRLLTLLTYTSKALKLTVVVKLFNEFACQ